MNKIKSIGKQLPRILSDLLIICLVVCIVVIFYQKVVLKKGTLKVGDYYIFQIISGSMENSLSIGDFIVIKDEDDYAVGNIVTYRDDEVYVTHRIQEIDDNQVVTRGDANNTND